MIQNVSQKQTNDDMRKRMCGKMNKGVSNFLISIPYLPEQFLPFPSKHWCSITSWQGVENGSVHARQVRTMEMVRSLWRESLCSYDGRAAHWEGAMEHCWWFIRCVRLDNSSHWIWSRFVWNSWFIPENITHYQDSACPQSHCSCSSEATEWSIQPEI